MNNLETIYIKISIPSYFGFRLKFKYNFHVTMGQQMTTGRIEKKDINEDYGTEGEHDYAIDSNAEYQPSDYDDMEETWTSNDRRSIRRFAPPKVTWLLAGCKMKPYFTAPSKEIILEVLVCLCGHRLYHHTNSCRSRSWDVLPL